MKKFLLLVKKDLKLLLRSKGSALIVLFAPLIIILLLGLTYNTNAQFGLNLGIHSSSITDEVTQFSNSLEAQDFSIEMYTNLDKCVDDIKFGFTHACISLPSNFQIEDNSAKEVTFYLDQSRINLVWIIQQALEKEFNLKSQELSQSIVDNILTKIETTQGNLDSEASQISDIKDTNDQTKSNADGVATSLDSINFQIPELTEDGESVSSVADESLDNIFSLALDDANDAIDALNAASVTGDALTKVEDLKSRFSNAKNQLSGSATGNVSDVLQLIVEVEAQVDLLMSRLQSVSSAVDSATSQTGEITTTLDSTSNSLEDVRSSILDIKNSLGSLDVSDSETISTPLITTIEPINEAGTNLNYTFPSLLALIVMFLAIMLGNTLVMMEKMSPAYMRNFMIPVNKVVFVLATIFTNLLIISLQLIIILAISLAFLPNTFATLPALFLVLLLSGLVFTLIGMFVGYLFSSEETAILASISLGSIFLFLSGLILPIEGMSSGLRALTAYNPFVITERLVREVFIFQNSLSSTFETLGLLLIYILVLFIVILITNTFFYKHLMHRIVYKRHKKKRKKAEKVVAKKEEVFEEEEEIVE